MPDSTNANLILLHTHTLSRDKVNQTIPRRLFISTFNNNKYINNNDGSIILILKILLLLLHGLTLIKERPTAVGFIFPFMA